VTSAARAANAGTVIASSIVAAGDSMQLQVRLLDGATGAVIRAIAPPRLVRGGGADAIAEAMDRVLAAVALVTDPAGGVAALPLGDPPRLAAVLELREGLQAFGAMRAYDTLGRRVTLGHLRRATELDPAFVQPRLFVALSYVWNGALGRNPAARLVIDSVVGEIGAMREKLSPYEGALADALVASSHEIDERALQSVRRVVTMLPLSGIARALPSQLLDLNRPREALSQMERLHALSRGDSTSTRLPEVAYWTRIAEVEHYLGDYRKELDAARQAEAEAPSDIEGKRGELRALAGLADSATLGRKLDDVEGASTGGGAYSFAGDVFLNIAQELVAHDQPALGARVLLRSIRWFDQHPDQERLNPNAGLRHAMALHVAGRLDDAIAILRRFQEANPADLRFEGYLARVLVSKGDTASALEELGRLAAMPSEQMGGVPAQERAFLLARLGPAHWDEAVRVLDESFRQGASFSVRRRLHAFTDWVPLKDYAPFRKVIEPKG
jgi:tetratricopeptide (TPR) repeat protein